MTQLSKVWETLGETLGYDILTFLVTVAFGFNPVQKRHPQFVGLDPKRPLDFQFLNTKATVQQDKDSRSRIL